MFCTNCGRAIPEESLVCGYCGNKVEIPRKETVSVTQMSAGQQGETEGFSTEFTENKAMDRNSQSLDDCSEEISENPEETEQKDETNASEYVFENRKNEVEVPLQAIYSEAGIIDKYNKPLNTVDFWAMQLVLLIPGINLLLLFVWAFRAGTNQNRKAYARSKLIWVVIGMVGILSGLIALLFMRYPLDLNYWFQEFKNFINSISRV